MIKLLHFLWHGCWHKWVSVKTIPTSNDVGENWYRYVCRCEKCGWITGFDSH